MSPSKNLKSFVALVAAFALVGQSTAMAAPQPLDVGVDSVKGQITAIQAGTRIEVHLKNKQTLRGTRGEVADSGFTLASPNGGSSEITFAEVASVKQLTRKSHTTRNILIGVGIGVVVLAVVVARGAAQAGLLARL